MEIQFIQREQRKVSLPVSTEHVGKYGVSSQDAHKVDFQCSPQRINGKCTSEMHFWRSYTEVFLASEDTRWGKGLNTLHRSRAHTGTGGHLWLAETLEQWANFRYNQSKSGQWTTFLERSVDIWGLTNRVLTFDHVSRRGQTSAQIRAETCEASTPACYVRGYAPPRVRAENCRASILGVWRRRETCSYGLLKGVYEI